MDDSGKDFTTFRDVRHKRKRGAITIDQYIAETDPRKRSRSPATYLEAERTLYKEIARAYRPGPDELDYSTGRSIYPMPFHKDERLELLIRQINADREAAWKRLTEAERAELFDYFCRAMRHSASADASDTAPASQGVRHYGRKIA